MKRAIKFRAWDNKLKRFSDDGTVCLNRCGHIFVLHNTEYTSVEQSTYTLLQYTGLKDKNGKEIYEGDIVSWFRKDVKDNKIENRYPVCFGLYDNDESYSDWCGGNGWYLGQEMFFRAGERDAGGWESKCRDLMEGEKLEVVGNIWENKELLE